MTQEKTELFEAPVDQLVSLLGTTLTKERQALSYLCGLLRAHWPTKIVKIGKANDVNILALLKCIQLLDMECQVYIVDSQREHDFFTIHSLHDLNKKRQQCGLSECPCKLLFGHTFAAWIETIGNEIDFLLLDAVDNMPEDVLDFIAAAPYLKRGAIVALYDAVFSGGDTPLPTNKLFPNILADKYQSGQIANGDMWQQIPYISQYVLEAFEMNPGIMTQMGDLFVLLESPWSHAPRLPLMMEYAGLIENQYDAKCVKLYQQVLFDRWGGMTGLLQSVLSSFPHVLLYGKGERGQCFLQVAKAVGVTVDGFIVSDGQNTVKEAYGLPVYEYSKIPFSGEDIFIIQTAFSKEIEERLRQSEYHWLRLPETFWEGGR